MPTDKNKIDALICHGVHFHHVPAKGTAEGTCPFCGKEDHFHCHVGTGKYQCKVCGKEGNHYTFLHEHYTRTLKKTTKADYDMLSTQRGNLPAAAFKDDLAYDRAQHRWLMPLCNLEGKLANLLRWDAHEDKPAAKSTPACSLHLGWAEHIKSVGPIHICEGRWDAAALKYLFTKLKIDSATNSIVYVPGANFNLDRYADVFKGRDLVFYYHNDPAGFDGQAKGIHLFQGKAKSAAGIHWPEEFPKGYDVRDFVLERIKNLKKCHKDLQGLFTYNAPVEKKNLPKVPDFPALVKQFRKVLHLEQNQLDALAVCVAVVASHGTKGAPLWVFLVGPPGSGKSELLMAFSQLEEKCLFVSRLTSETFISGMDLGENDPSLMARINNRCLIIKDFTSVKAMSLEKQVDLFGILRDAYDGEVSRPFGNGKVRDYKECWFPMIAGVTHVIHADNQSAYGERFLKFELLGEDHDVQKQTNASMEKATKDSKAKVPDETLKNAILAFFSQKKMDRAKLPDVMATKYRAKFLALAQIVAIVRTSADKKGAVYAYRPIPENPGRLGAQFIKLAQHLCWVFGKPRMDQQVFEIVKKQGTDSVISWSLEIMRALVKSRKGLSTPDMTRELQVAVETIRPHLDTLCQIVYPYGKNDHGPIIKIRDEAIGDSGLRTRRVYQLDERFVTFWKEAELPFDLKASKRKPTRGPKKGTRYTRKAKPTDD